MSDLLELEDLRVSAGPHEIVRGVDLAVPAGQTVAVVGESGSGKSLTMLSVMGLLSPPLRVSGGHVRLAGWELTGLHERQLREIRGNEVAMIYQDPMTSLNPLMRVGEQVMEAMTAHGVAKAQARERMLDLLARVGIPDPRRTARAYPHEFSGGMRQRVMIASALAMRPKLLIADEPTTALDVTIQQQILALVDELRQELGMTTIWVTHDLGVVARLVDRVVVMYAGHVVEDAPVRQVFAAPQHPYTASLLASLPDPNSDGRGRLATIPGRPPTSTQTITGCPFRPRCAQARDICAVRPELLPRTLPVSPTAAPAAAGGAVAEPAAGGGAAVAVEAATTRVACHVPPAEWR
ncbi:ABC transporter ATP-binding protein [Rugosimonospora africana]|uniref:Peptide ABC transporter ATP-binding protein n=1 Tax=Rugosimonospora africana TaxID=556532 RepID=A0A8J3VPX8_9ACTN|nr:ABC transporter ATP-binding protein [Rugosimonospora africana]GIH13886.1 peptide ABC transporter ATP-binding protein [Rugosimonospora africana]